MSLREKKLAKKKHEILRTAATILAEKGYHGTTMEEIAQNLLMTKGSMYYYFKNKDDLLYNCHLMIMEISLKKIEEVNNSDLDPVEKLKKAISEHILLATTETSMFMIIDKPTQTFTGENLENILKMRKQYSLYFDEMIYDGIEKGYFRNVDVKMIRFIILGALNWVQQWYSPEGGNSSADVADKFSNYLLSMLLN